MCFICSLRFRFCAGVSWKAITLDCWALICIRAFSLHVWHSCNMRWSSSALVESRHRTSTYRKPPTHRCLPLWRIVASGNFLFR